MDKINIYDKERRVEDPGIAREMAEAEAPYHEKTLGFLQPSGKKLAEGDKVAEKVGDIIAEQRFIKVLGKNEYVNAILDREDEEKSNDEFRKMVKEHKTAEEEKNKIKQELLLSFKEAIDAIKLGKWISIQRLKEHDFKKPEELFYLVKKTEFSRKKEGTAEREVGVERKEVKLLPKELKEKMEKFLELDQNTLEIVGIELELICGKRGCRPDSRSRIESGEYSVKEWVERYNYSVKDEI